MLIRAAVPDDAADIARVHLTTWRAAFLPLMKPEHAAQKNLDLAIEIDRWQKRLTGEPERITFVAEDDGQIVGFITGGAAPESVGEYNSELYQIYVLPEAQRGRIGQKMVRALATSLQAAGYEKMLVWVITLNPAVTFYRDALGGVFLTERPIAAVNGELSEAAYGYDLARLVERLAA
jgi:ribosomal protein S18 acetylase RimI-like enzyme